MRLTAAGLVLVLATVAAVARCCASTGRRSPPARNREAGRRKYRAYGLANFAHDILSAAEPRLREQGCDVAGLL